MALRARIYATGATVAFAFACVGVSAAHAAPGCPAGPDTGPCTIAATASNYSGYLSVFGFSPRSDVRFEVFESEGGRRIYGPVTRKTDASGFRNAPGDLDGFVPGNFVVATDLATGTVKTLLLDPIALRAIDYTNDTASGIANPGVLVEATAQSVSEAGVFSAWTHADAAGRWTADFRAAGFDLVPGMSVKPSAIDEDGDRTDGVRDPGCGGAATAFSAACVLYADTTNDVIGADAMAPNSDVRFEVFDRKGGARIFGPVTVRTDEGGGAEVELGFDYGLDLGTGHYVVARDLASGVTKHLQLAPLSITRLDPATDMIDGTAPAGATVSVGGPVAVDVQAGSRTEWSFDFNTIGYDVTDTDSFSAVLYDVDEEATADWSKTYRGSPVPDCVPDETTICGTAGPEALHTDSAATAAVAAQRPIRAAAKRLKVAAGGRNDTVVASVSRRTRSVRIDTGTGGLDRVVVRALRRARGNVRVRGRSRRLAVVLPAHAWGITATVVGTKGRDRVGTRRFGGKGASRGGYRILGKGGNDRLRGGDGRDTLIGGRGRDTCYADELDTVRSCEIVRRV